MSDIITVDEARKYTDESRAQAESTISKIISDAAKQGSYDVYLSSGDTILNVEGIAQKLKDMGYKIQIATMGGWTERKNVGYLISWKSKKEDKN